MTISPNLLIITGKVMYSYTNRGSGPDCPSGDINFIKCYFFFRKENFPQLIIEKLAERPPTIWQRYWFSLLANSICFYVSFHEPCSERCGT